MNKMMFEMECGDGSLFVYSLPIIKPKSEIQESQRPPCEHKQKPSRSSRRRQHRRDRQAQLGVIPQAKVKLTPQELQAEELRKFRQKQHQEIQVAVYDAKQQAEDEAQRQKRDEEWRRDEEERSKAQRERDEAFARKYEQERAAFLKAEAKREAERKAEQERRVSERLARKHINLVAEREAYRTLDSLPKTHFQMDVEHRLLSRFQDAFVCVNAKSAKYPTFRPKVLRLLTTREYNELLEQARRPRSDGEAKERQDCLSELFESAHIVWSADPDSQRFQGICIHRACGLFKDDFTGGRKDKLEINDVKDQKAEELDIMFINHPIGEFFVFRGWHEQQYTRGAWPRFSKRAFVPSEKVLTEIEQRRQLMQQTTQRVKSGRVSQKRVAYV